MAYVKICDKCGARISMRQMSQGQWVSFDVGSDEPHEHGVAGKKSTKKIVRKKKASKTASINMTLDEMHIIDRMGEVHDLNDIPEEWLDLTALNLKKLFNILIDSKRRAQIQYVDRDGDTTSRIIYPVSLIQGYAGKQSTSKTLKVAGFCKLREGYRTFLLNSIVEIQAQKKIPKSFLDKFGSLSSQEKNKIIEGSNFYGSNSRYIESNDLESIKTENGSANSIDKINLKPKSKTKKIITPIKESNYSHSPESDDGLWSLFWWALFLIVLYNIFTS